MCVAVTPDSGTVATIGPTGYRTDVGADRSPELATTRTTRASHDRAVPLRFACDRRPVLVHPTVAAAVPVATRLLEHEEAAQ